MDSSTPWRSRVADVLGPFEVTGTLGPGICRIRGGSESWVVKTGQTVADEATGLRALTSVAGGPSVPEVLVFEYTATSGTSSPSALSSGVGCPDPTGLETSGPLRVSSLTADPAATAGAVPHEDRDDGLLVMRWIEEAGRTPRAEERLGRELAILHSAAWPGWGGGSSWIGSCPVDPSPTESGPEFLGRRLADLGGSAGLTQPISALIQHLPDLIPPGPPALVHGDLWWGNVLWGSADRPWVIDPSVHGGYPEEDLAMLALFGGLPDRFTGAYEEVRPLAEGWRERVGLFQLVPLLVHAVLFGAAYRRHALEVLCRYVPVS